MDNKTNCNSINFSTKNQIIMGILNITDDSFYDGSRFNKNIDIVSQSKKMLDEGAEIIDIGAQSTRPGAKMVSSKEEIKKLIPVIKLLKTENPNIIISIDTFWSDTAKACVDFGANIINDISAGNIDKKMFETIANLKVPYIIMHMKGVPSSMQLNPKYENIVEEIIIFFNEKIKILNQMGVKNIILDPGFGFGKNLTHNYQILNNLEKFKINNLPILIGMSRKSMIYKLLETNANNSLNGTSVLHTIALQKGINILRVHDVKEAMECIKITNFAKKLI